MPLLDNPIDADLVKITFYAEWQGHALHSMYRLSGWQGYTLRYM